MPDTSGPSLPTPLAFYDPDSSCWKTSQGTFLSDSTESSLTLPASGMTLGGRLYELPTSEPATAAPDCSSSPFLPTPTVADDNGTIYRNPRADANFDTHHSVTLAQVAYKRLYTDLLPTPSAADGMGGHKRRGGDRGDELLLAGLAKDVTLLRSPSARDGESRGVQSGAQRLAAGHQMNLPEQIKDLFPTPTRRDHKGHNQRHDETCLTGALTAPPSPDTPPPSDDQHPTLWTVGDG